MNNKTNEIIGSITQSKIEKFLKDEIGEMLIANWPGHFTNIDSKRDDAIEKLKIQIKKDGTSVTEIDKIANTKIVEFLKNEFTDFGVISEELPIEDEELTKDYIWITDPLDGTSSYINGRDDFSVLLALIQKRKIIYGTMYFPQLKIFASSYIGMGATINNNKLSVSNNSVISEEKLFCRKFSLVNNLNLAYKEYMDSGYALLELARGRLDAVIIKMITHKEWDIASPTLIIKEAGGQVTDETGSEIEFGNKFINFDYYVASNKKVHKEVLEVLSQEL